MMNCRLRIRTGLSLVAVSLTMLCQSASAEDAKLKVTTFAGPQGLALFVAKDKGIFQKNGLSVDITFTPNSQVLRDGIAKGDFEIAQAGVDNALAMVETAKKDVVIIGGGSNGMNELMVRPEINTYEGIRGKTVVVDAPNTAFALLLYKALSMNGLKKGDYSVLPAGGCTTRLGAMRADPSRVAAMMNPPCNIQAAKEGYKSFGLATDMIGPYQADGIWVMRSWAKAHPDLVVKYLRSVIEGYRWAVKPENRAEVVDIVAKQLKIDQDTAAKSVNATIGPHAGMAKDLRFDQKGFKNTLSLRAEFEGGDPKAKSAKYLDLSYYKKALKGVKS